MITLYTKVKHLLMEFPELRDSDRKLVWKIWGDEGSFDGYYRTVNFRGFMKATGYDTISRARRMVQNKCPELRGTLKVRIAKRIKQDSKGTFIFRETFTGQLFN